jgi:sodium-dependent dicarboxylate transporter 2/3/5
LDVPAVKLWGLALGALAFATLLIWPAPAGLSIEGWRVAALLALMVIWWLTEAAPLPATALLPFLLLPFLGAGSAEDVARSSMSPLLGLVFGAMLIAAATVKCGLHRRLARLAVRLGGGGARQLVLAMMIATGLLAMWIAPGALSIFMIEIGSVVAAAAIARDMRESALDVDQRRFACAMVIGIAYAAALGGAATLTANPVNAIAAGMIGRQTGVDVGFVDWLLIGAPVAMIGVPLAWFILVFVVFRFEFKLPERAALVTALQADGESSAAQARVVMVAAATFLGLVALPAIKAVAPAATEGAVAVFGGVLLFLVPAGGEERQPLLSWQDAARIPWGAIVLIGGALALTAAISTSGLAAWLAAPLANLAGAPVWLGLLALVVGAALLTEVMSNFALTAIAVPAAIVLAAAIGGDPVLFGVGAALAAGGGYIMPGPPWLSMAATTPPVRFADLLRSGIPLNIAAPLLITAACLFAALARG